MRKALCFIFCTLLLAGCSSGNISKRYQTEPSEMVPMIISSTEDVTELAEGISPAIVGISCQSGNKQSLGSGVCVGSGGYILTNQHVINNSSSITLHLSDGTTASAILLWQDSSLDIAILKADTSIPYLSLGNSDDCLVGQDVVAVGTPINLQFNHTFTKGIISALNRTLQVSNNSGITYMQNLIQHDASLNPGNSGGPLVNKYGEVVGINTLKISDGEGMGFAIPSKSIVQIVEKVMEEESDYVTPYMGLFGYDTAIANYYDKTDQTEGIYVLDVADESPAKLSGLQEGDVVLSVDGKKICNMLDFRDVIFSKNCYDSIELMVNRNNKNYKCTLKLQPHPTTNTQ